jgi:hypothetical protein
MCVCVCDLAPSFGRGSVGSVGLPGGWPSCSASTSTSSRRADRASKAQDARGTLICIFSAACRWVGYDPSEANSHRCPLFSVGSWIIRSLKENISLHPECQAQSFGYSRHRSLAGTVVCFSCYILYFLRRLAGAGRAAPGRAVGSAPARPAAGGLTSAESKG